MTTQPQNPLVEQAQADSDAAELAAQGEQDRIWGIVFGDGTPESGRAAREADAVAAASAGREPLSPGRRAKVPREKTVEERAREQLAVEKEVARLKAQEARGHERAILAMLGVDPAQADGQMRFGQDASPLGTVTGLFGAIPKREWEK